MVSYTYPRDQSLYLITGDTQGEIVVSKVDLLKGAATLKKIQPIHRVFLHSGAIMTMKSVHEWNIIFSGASDGTIRYFRIL